MSGTTLITEERLRQINEEGWTLQHDDMWANNQLVGAAVCYLMWKIVGSDMFNKTYDYLWKWDNKWWKPKERIHNLVVAGALIAAEIDRIQRLEAEGANNAKN